MLAVGVGFAPPVMGNDEPLALVEVAPTRPWNEPAIFVPQPVPGPSQ